ncbi:MAG: hypothetical protein DMF50_06995 [Acidobacteria bacterium]|nr:MAG: hypothetical protein DMF50_06995 [Acidobacteriota bacterium]
MTGLWSCLIWGEGPDRPACLGAGAPSRPVPPHQGAAARRSSARRGAAIVGLAVLLAAFGPLPALADEAGSPARDALPLPPGAPTVDPALGLAGVSVPIEVPPGRHGMQPSLVLKYSSGAGAGNAGFGFTLVAGSIERSTRFGTPRFDDSDTFVLTLWGESHDLVPIDSGATRFRTALDTGFLIERVSPGPFGPGSSYWLARGRDGRAYRFGSAVDALTGNVTQVPNFKWGLERVEDASGNVMEIQYQSSGLHLYPVGIDYAAHPASGLAATNEVRLCWERRGDEAPTPSGERLRYRLLGLVTSAQGKTARTYGLRYDAPGNSAETLGSCALVQASAPGAPGANPAPGTGGPGDRPRPKTILSDALATRSLAPSGAGLYPDDSLLTAVVRGDGNGAFLPTVEYSYRAESSYGWPEPAPGGALPLPFVGGSDKDVDPGVRLIDLNRDGLPDLVQLVGYLNQTTYQVTRGVYLNTGHGFTYDTAFSDGLLNLLDPADQSRSAYFVLKRGGRDQIDNGVRFLDVNDDGYVDVVRMAVRYGTYRKGVFLNTGSGFTRDVSASYAVPDEPFVWMHDYPTRDLADDLGVRFADVNGDGRTDILVGRAEWNGPVERRVYLYDRGGYRLDKGWNLPEEPFVRHVRDGRWVDMGVRLMDLNRDGLPDLFVAANVDGTLRSAAWINTGRPGGPAPTWDLSPGDWSLYFMERFVDVTSLGQGGSQDRGLRVADLDGDGRTDIVLSRSWDGGPDEKYLYTPYAAGGWLRRYLPEFPGLFVVKAAGGPPRDQGVRLADLDGDGGADYAFSRPGSPGAWHRNRAWHGRPLMASYSNGLGGAMEIAYAPASHGGATEGGGHAALPFPLAVVSSLTVADGLGNRYVTRYGYEGGFYHHRARDFRGFRSVTRTDPGGGRTIETSLFQQPAFPAAPLKGAVEERVERRASDGAVFSRAAWIYDTGGTRLPLLHPLLRSETVLYDWTTDDPQSPAFVRKSAVSYAYLFDETSHPPDRLLLRRTEIQEGDVTDAADDRAIVEEFAGAMDAGAASGPAAGRWFLDLPFHRAVSGADGTVVAEGWTSYDGLSPGAIGLRALPTGEERRGGPPGPPGVHGPGDPENPVTRRTYDVYGNLDSETDPLGRTRRIDRGLSDPSFTFPESETDALARVTTRTFDARTGLLVRLADPNGAATQTEYDPFGRRVAEYGPYDSSERPTVSYRYDFTRLPSRVVRYAREQSGLGERAGTAGTIESMAFFDGLGRLLETKTESTGGTMIVSGARTFDDAGRLRSEAEPFRVPAGPEFVPAAQGPRSRVMEYDAGGRLISVTNAAGEVRGESASGWSSILSDPLGHRREVMRDAFGEVVRVVEYEGTGASSRPSSTSTYRYDAAGRLVRVVDPLGATTTLAYDLLGRRLALDDPQTGSWRSRYDLQGNLIEEIDPSGRTTRTSYDDLDRLVEKVLADGTHHRWGYDEGGAAAAAFGRLTSIGDPSGTQSFAHDLLGHVVSATRILEGVSYTVRTTFDALGRVDSLRLPGAPAVRYAYDEGGNVRSLLPFASSFGYNERGQVTSTLLSNGMLVARAYDPATGRPLELAAWGPDGSILLRLASSYQADGQIAALDDLTDPAAARRQVFAYDGRHRLTRATGPYGDLTYLYDDGGNLLAKEGVSFSYDDASHPQRVTRTSDGRSLAYDDAGNVTLLRSAGGERSLIYDAAGRMRTLFDSAAGVTVAEDYDASGQRVREVTETPTARSVLLTPMPEVEVRDGLTTLHYFAGELRLATVDSAGRTLFPVADHLGSTRIVADEQGALVARYDYAPYGTAVPRPGGAVPVSRLYAGTLTNRDTGLLQMGSRHYDPALGRFLQPDGLVGRRFDPHMFNRYAYARDNPVNLTDPDGKNPLFAILFIGAIALLDRDTRADVGTSVSLTAASILLTAVLGPGGGAGWRALMASRAALYAAAVTPVLLHSPLGEAIVESYGLLFQDLGLSPRGSAVAAEVMATLLVNSSMQRAFAQGLAPKGEARGGFQVGGRGALDGYLEAQGSDVQSIGAATGDAYGSRVQSVGDPGTGSRQLDRFYSLLDESDRIVGVYGVRDIGPFLDHGAVGMFGEAPATPHPHYAYGLGGISTQQFARDLFAAGYSGSLYTLTGRASDYLIEFVYGPYGGGLALGFNAARSFPGGRGAEESP